MQDCDFIVDEVFQKNINIDFYFEQKNFLNAKLFEINKMVKIEYNLKYVMINYVITKDDKFLYFNLIKPSVII